MKLLLTLCALGLVVFLAIPVPAQQELTPAADERTPTEVDRRLEEARRRQEELQADLARVEREIVLLEELKEIVAQF